jgi:hypothetical protein
VVLYLRSPMSSCRGTRVYTKVSGQSHNKQRRRRQKATQRFMVAELTRLTHRTAIQLHLVAESCTICSSRSRRPVWKILDTPSYVVKHMVNLTFTDKGLGSAKTRHTDIGIPQFFSSRTLCRPNCRYH